MDRCDICLENLCKPCSITNCQHVFHQECVYGFQKGPTCLKKIEYLKSYILPFDFPLHPEDIQVSGRVNFSKIKFKWVDSDFNKYDHPISIDNFFQI